MLLSLNNGGSNQENMQTPTTDILDRVKISLAKIGLLLLPVLAALINVTFAINKTHNNNGMPFAWIDFLEGLPVVLEF